MSIKRLKKAAQLKVPQQMPDMETKLLMMVMADRADDQGLVADVDDTLMAETAAELNAIRARLRGDQFVRPGVDNARVNRVIEALRKDEDE